MVVVPCHARGCDSCELFEASDRISAVPYHIAKAKDRVNPLTLKKGEDSGQGLPV
jgi:hypothetical protein